MTRNGRISPLPMADTVVASSTRRAAGGGCGGRAGVERLGCSRGRGETGRRRELRRTVGRGAAGLQPGQREHGDTTVTAGQDKSRTLIAGHPLDGHAEGASRASVVAMHSVLNIHPEVAAALAEGRPVVALESTIISHGLPRPANLETALRIEETVRSAGAVPATIAVVDGRVCVGLDEARLDAVAMRDDVVKVSLRDVATLVARGGIGATTVASTSHVAALAGIHVFATGGLGGVHREARDTWDESADLTTLGVTPVTVVCAGVKSILDVPATLERLETLNVGVVGYGTDSFPGFYLSDSGYALDWRVDSPLEVAQIMAPRRELRLASALIVGNPLPAEDALDPELHDRVLDSGLAAAARKGVRGKDVTPFLLDHFHRETHGASLEANVKIVLRNAELAAAVAVEDTALRLGQPVLA